MSTSIPGGTASHRCRRIYDAVLRQCDQLETLASQPDDRLFFRAEKVSNWSAADHLLHIALTTRAMSGVIRRSIESEDASAAGGRTLVGRAVLATGWIPRGVGKAPKEYLPQVSSRDEVAAQLEEAHRAVRLLESGLPGIESARARSNHFAFGDLTAFQWLQLVKIHTRHHLKIVRDVQRAPGSP